MASNIGLCPSCEIPPAPPGDFYFMGKIRLSVGTRAFIVRLRKQSLFLPACSVWPGDGAVFTAYHLPPESRRALWGQWRHRVLSDCRSGHHPDRTEAECWPRGVSGRWAIGRSGGTGTASVTDYCWNLHPGSLFNATTPFPLQMQGSFQYI